VKYDFYLGIDPGVGGGIAGTSSLSGAVSAIKMPRSDKKIWERIALFECHALAVIEAIPPAIGIRNVKGLAAGKSQMSKLYGSYRALLMALTIAKIEIVKVKLGQVWRAFGIPPRTVDETKQSQWKGRIKAKAQQIFPQLRVTLHTADALLFAEYGRRLSEGLLVAPSAPRLSDAGAAL